MILSNYVHNVHYSKIKPRKRPKNGLERLYSTNAFGLTRFVVVRTLYHRIYQGKKYLKKGQSLPGTRGETVTPSVKI